MINFTFKKERANVPNHVFDPGSLTDCGILILVIPRLLNYIVAIYLIVIGSLGLAAVNLICRFLIIQASHKGETPC